MLRPCKLSRSRRVGAVVAGVLITTSGAACSSLRGAYSVAVNDDRSVRIVTGVRENLAANYIRFAPSSLVVRPGDGLRFENWSSGEPHAIAFGTAVDAAVRAIAALGDEPSAKQVLELPEVQRLPKPFDQAATGDTPTVDARAAEPCVVLAGEPIERCSSSKLPELDGRAVLVGSGLLDEGEVFRLRLDGDMPPGEYGYIDLAHPEVAYGRMTVVARGAERPTPGDAMDQADDELDIARQALRGVTPLVEVATAENAIAGIAAQEGFDHLLTFGVKPYVVPVGGKVTWRLFGMHSITFNPTADATRGLTVEVDGRRAANEAAWKAGGPQTTTAAPSTEDPLLTETRIDGGTWDGEGMHHSGIIRAYPPVRATYSLTFSSPGEYRYRCLLHDDMTGAVVVTD